MSGKQQEARTLRREPNPGETDTPLFNAIWQVVKNWEIQTDTGSWYSATGNDVCAIIDSIGDLAARQASQPIHASGEPGQANAFLGWWGESLKSIVADSDPTMTLIYRWTEKAWSAAFQRGQQAMAEKAAQLVAKWRKIIAECPVERQKRWRDVFEAVETCASELEAALAREPGASEGT